MHMLLPRQMTNHWTKLHLGKDGFSSEGSGMDAFCRNYFCNEMWIQLTEITTDVAGFQGPQQASVCLDDELVPSRLKIYKFKKSTKHILSVGNECFLPSMCTCV